MSKIVSAYQTLTIESNLTKDQLATALRYKPQATTLFEEKTPVFAIALSKNSGAVSNNGVQFNAVTAEGKMYVTVTDTEIPADAEKRREFIEKNFGSILYKLNAVEAQIAAVLEQAANEIATVADSISVL